MGNKCKLFIVFILLFVFFISCDGNFIVRQLTDPLFEKTLTVINGTGSGKYKIGDVVTITASTSPTGEPFSYWTSNAGGTFENINSPTTKFTIPKNDVIVTANFGTPGTIVNAQTPSITTQPAGATYTEGALATALSVTATVTDGGALSYQWYSNSTNSTSGGTPVGTNSNTYTPLTITVGTTYYYVVVTNTNNSVNGNKTATATSNVATVVINTASVSTIEMVTISGFLSFTMGQSDITDATPTRTVTFTSGFSISKHEVTQGQWKAVMGEDARITQVYSGTNYGRGDTYPMYYVSWYDALVFCNKLSMMEGRTPAYSIKGSTDPDAWGTVPTSSDSDWNAVIFNASSDGYRLPTEAQWEYACRAGTTTIWSYGDAENGDYMWYSGNNGASGTTYGSKPVGTKFPNDWGLFDMHGNVYEWCWDWYGTYPNSAETDPTGAASGTYRVVRSGSWSYVASFTRSAYRYNYGPGVRNGDLGFRVVRPAP